MTPVHTKSEFVDFSESEVFDALNDENPDNHIAVEVARLIEGYMKNFAEHVEQIGHIPPSILRSTGDCAIESVAMELVSNAVRKELGERK